MEDLFYVLRSLKTTTLYLSNLDRLIPEDKLFQDAYRFKNSKEAKLMRDYLEVTGKKYAVIEVTLQEVK